jgi:hypothetical protein
MKRKNLSLLFILSGGLIFLAIFALLIYQSGGKSSIPTPAKLAGLAHSRIVTRNAAVQEIQQMHGKNFEFTGASVVDYDAGRVRLWVAELRDSSQAEAMIQAMYDSIVLGKSPFTFIQQQGFGGRTIYGLEGLGQVHFYFQSGSRVVWLGADPDLAEAALDETLSFFP